MSAALVLWRISHNKNLLLAWSFVLDCGVVGSAALADAKWQKLKDKFKLFLKMGPNQNLSFYFCSFQIHFYRKNIDFSRIQTRIIRVEGTPADHLPTTMAPIQLNSLDCLNYDKHLIISSWAILEKLDHFFGCTRRKPLLLQSLQILWCLFEKLTWP